MKNKKEVSKSILSRRFELLLNSVKTRTKTNKEIIKDSQIIGKIIENRETGEIKIERY